MANQLLARLGIVMAVDSAELVTGLNAAKEKFTLFAKEVQRQSNEAAKMTMALKMATESYGKSLTEVQRVELELQHGKLAGNKVSDVQLKLLRDQAAAYDAVIAATKAAAASQAAQAQAQAETQRQSDAAANALRDLKHATDSYGQTATAVSRLEHDIATGRLATSSLSAGQVKALRDQAAAYDAVATAAKTATAAEAAHAQAQAQAQRQAGEVAKMVRDLKYATESYGKSLSAVQRLELEMSTGRLANFKLTSAEAKALRDQAAAYDAVANSASKASKAQGGKGGLRPDLQAALAYQTTDVITGLAGGQNPFMVLLQQGGQLRDQFGGFKPMFEAIASTFTVARVAAVGLAGSMATLAYAAYKGHEEQKQFNNSLILTGGYLNMTEKQFSALAASIGGKYRTSVGDVRDAMQAMASTGQFTSASLESVGAVVARIARLSGESATAVATSLTPALDGTAASAKRLNDQYHFLTLAQYQHIRQLEAQGRLQESVKYTADLLNGKLSRQTEELGYLAFAWDKAATFVGNFARALKDLGKSDSDAPLMALKKTLEGLDALAGQKLTGGLTGDAKAAHEARRAAIVEQIRELEKLRDKKLSDDSAAEKKAFDEKKKIDYVASGDAAKSRQLRYQAEDMDRAVAAQYMIVANDKISAIEEKRLQDRAEAERATLRANEDDSFKFKLERAKALSAQLRLIDAKASKEKNDIYEKDVEAYRVAAQVQSDEVAREKERIDFYKEHIFLSNTDLEIALSRKKTEQEIAAIYAKKDSGKMSDKDAAADELRRIQARREANVEQAIELKMLQDMNNTVFNGMASALDNFVRTGKFAFKDFARSVIMDLMAIAMKAQMLSLFKGVSFGSFATGATAATASALPGDSLDNMMSLTGAFGTARAYGGSVSGGSTYMVGENGPELFTSASSGTIIPNGQVGSAMGGSSGPVFNGPYIASMSAIDTQSAIQFLAKNKQAVWSANQSAQRALPMSR